MRQPSTNHTSQQHQAKEPYTTPELVTQEPLRDITADTEWVGDYEAAD